MKLELNKRYVRRDGVITGPLELNTTGYGDDFPFTDPSSGITYAESGFRYYGTAGSDGDIVDEYPEQSESLSTPVHNDLESRILNLLRTISATSVDRLCDDISSLVLELESRIGNREPAVVEPVEFKLEAGKRYKTRAGLISEPVIPRDSVGAIEYPFRARITEHAASYVYTASGAYSTHGHNPERDLVEEYVEPENPANFSPLAPAVEPSSASQQMQVAVDAALAYPEAMQYLNDREITFMIRDDDRYHVTTLNDGTYTINEAGFLFKQIKL